MEKEDFAYKFYPARLLLLVAPWGFLDLRPRNDMRLSSNLWTNKKALHEWQGFEVLFIDSRQG